MPVAWRIVKTRLVASAFDGEGARLHGGRWNAPGTPLVYTSATLSLAALELLVHLQSSELLASYSAIPVRFDPALIEAVEPARLPPDWRRSPAPRSAWQLGSEWAAEQRSAVLELPSVIIPHESNFLINPSHPDFERMDVSSPAGFEFDSRLR